jgi:hypothetical protein
MRRIKTPPRDLVEYVWLKTFPASTRRLQLKTRRVHYSGGPDWFYITQELGSHLYSILSGIIASYLFERLRRPKGESVIITDVLERVAEDDVVTYHRRLRKADLLSADERASAPASVVTIIEKHRTLASALSDAQAAEELLLPLLEDAASSTKKARTTFLSRYGR